MVCGGHAVAVGAGGAPLLPVLPSHPPRVLSAGARPRYDRGTVRTAVAARRRKSLPPRQPCSCCERFVRKRQRMKKAPFSGSFLRAVAEKVRRGQAHIVRREGRGKGRAEKREALFVCTVALPVSWDVPCLAPDASPPEERFLSPHDGGRDLPERPEETFSGEGGGGGGRPPFFQRDSCHPRHNRPGDDSRTGKTSRPVPDRWRSARPFR